MANDLITVDIEELAVGVLSNDLVEQSLDRALMSYANHFGDQALLLYVEEWAKRNGLPWTNEDGL